MCGGKKEEKKGDAPPPETPPETPPPTEEAQPPSPEEPPKGAGSAAKSMGSKMTDSKMAAGAPSIALMTGRKGGMGAGLAKGPVGAESIAGAKGAPSLMLTSGRAAGPGAGGPPKGGISQTFGAGKKSAIAKK